MYNATAIHAFAGGFTIGVSKVFNVQAQLEIHGFGFDTATAAGFNVINKTRNIDWPNMPTDFCFGNPRCTSFSSLSSGAGCDTRGSFAGACQDIIDIIDYGLRVNSPVIAFESVQTILSVGECLLAALVERVSKEGYRVAHILQSGQQFGNAQLRQRYFFVAYKGDKYFNIRPPILPNRLITVGDIICTKELLDRETSERHLYGSPEYTPESYTVLTEVEYAAIPHLQPGECMNQLAARLGPEADAIHTDIYATVKRCKSIIPFSLHCIRRLDEHKRCPTINSSSGRFIHPTIERPITVEECALLMGWPKGFTPIGRQPMAQIGKGIIPAAGEWLANQVVSYLDNEWDEDFSLEYDRKDSKWRGEIFKDKPLVKMFNMKGYLPL